MAKIAGYSMTSWKGDVPPMANLVTARERAGTDGYTFICSGKRSPPFQVVTTSMHGSIAEARTRAGDYEGLIASFVTLEDPSGRSCGRVMVLGVVARAFRVLQSTDGNTAGVECTWSLQRGR